MKNIGVFFGSVSPEHDISIITAQLIIAGLKGLNYQVTPVYISKNGQWLIDEKLGNLKTFTQPENFNLHGFNKYYLDLEESLGKIVFRKKGILTKKIVIDLAFPAFHGSFGEDGTIQGLFEILKVPYVGCDVPSSAIAMDKALNKMLYLANNIPTTKFIYFEKNQWQDEKNSILAKIKNNLKWPVFIKPVHLGSSIGISKVKDKKSKDLEFQIEVALHYDNRVLIEEGVENLMDVTCCLLGNENPKTSKLQESLFQSDLFDFEKKYISDGGAQLGKSQDSLMIPARLDPKITKEIQETAVRIFKIVGCSGIARIDFLYNKKTGKFFANEINPLPGTLYHHLWQTSGIELPELLEELIRLAEEKHNQKQTLNYTFSSSVLTQLGSTKLSSEKL